MNRKKIEFKYLMGLWKSLPEYPTESDLIYEISVFLEKDGRPDGEFSKKTYNSIWGQNWSEDFGDSLESMVLGGKIERVDKKGGSKDWFKIKNNPYYG